MVVQRFRSARGLLGRSSGLLIMAGIAIATVACGKPVEPAAQAQPEQQEGPAVVDTAVAAAGEDSSRIYTGTTSPAREVSLRSQAEGRLLSLTRDVGDTVQQGQVIATIDNVLLQTAVGEAQAELAARQFEVAQAEAELADIRTSIEDARVRLQQASNDAQRLVTLASQGAISTQAAEQAQTTLRTSEQALASSQEQVRTRQQAVAAAQQRVEAQRSILRETQQRLSFANLTASLSGVVLERVAEPGDLILPGEAVLTLGDLSEVLVVIEVADSSLSEFSVGQSVEIAIDAFPNETFTGQVTRISPVADSTSRLLPIEITVANPGSRIGSGLLARVTSTGNQSDVVVVPESALETAENSDNQIFVVTEAKGDPVVESRSVQVGDRADGQATILSGLAPGEQYVVRSSQPLEAGQAVELSLTSEG
ncbi:MULTISPECIES: efflux RND transporter periplasmic adaptor subunit [Cyanophyceae]|uniref:Efflux RND transporter periplasmic adaptor subunit n=1 Tax=Leptolyngbya subtilissima DQ-A4 TaxID=2933933 RepID=A0ABV0K1A3_9CYAN|nr:efflux RND transporter periplasmic adaptor subunit [Nodosilinea sp. FACHB-141]MBD2111334.1 efflux RND transporter periplasmic adaptor subunit [Nodosilinea sp. FACHB-141]